MKLRISRAVGVSQPNNIGDVKKIQMLLTELFVTIRLNR